MGGAVKGVILDGSALLTATSVTNAAPSLRPGADFLLRTLQFSQLHAVPALYTLHAGISYGSDLSADEVSVLKRLSTQYEFDCFSFNVSALDDIVHELATAWGDIGGSVLFLFFHDKKGLYIELCNYGWVLLALDDEAGESDSVDSRINYVSKLEEVPLNICRLNKKGIGNEFTTVGYFMKPSRKADFAKRGAFPLYSEKCRLMFLPITYEISLPLQLGQLDVLLHKATDEIISVELSGSSTANPRITYSSGMQELCRLLEHQPNLVIIDPFDSIYPVLNREVIQQVLLGLNDLQIDGHSGIRGPRFLKVHDFNEPDLIKRLSHANLSYPNIVKPQVACGVADAHSMAIVFRFEDYKDLSVPLPAIIQEYVDHSSILFKFYVLSEKVFYAVKKSTPNADTLMKSSPENAFKPLLFDSLKSLPVADKSQSSHEACTDGGNNIDLELVTNAANWLRGKLGLTIFGFDVVIQEGTGDHVIVDVNYLPSFKEVPNDIAIPAFWEAIRNKFEKEKKM